MPETKRLVGKDPNQVPRNKDLGSMAYEDHDNVVITGGTAVLSSATVNSLQQTTEIGNVPPTLNLNFAKTKSLDPRITFARASEARFYDGKTFAKAEENLLLQSQDFTTTWAGATATITSNSTAAPDGTTTADTLTATATTNIHLVNQTIVGNTSARVLSVFAKKSTHDFIQLCVSNDAAPFANFNLATGVVGTLGAGVTSSIQDVGNGWYRCSMVFTSTASNAADVALVTSASAVRRESWAAAGTEAVFLWGAQLEQRSAVSAYTPTTTAPITNYIPQLMTAASGVARFDHNPLTSESLGLLIEEQRTNLCLNSEALANGSLVSILANAAIAPDGALTMDGLIETTGSGEHYPADHSFTPTAATTYTWSCYAKALPNGATRRLFLRVAGGNTANAYFSLVDGSLNSTSGTQYVSAGSQSVGNGVFRFWITWTGANATSTVCRTQLATSDNTFNYVGDGFSGLYVWGRQLEAGAFPTSYIPTTAAQATRIGDGANMTGANFSSWYRQDQGTMFAEASISAFSPSAVIEHNLFCVSDNTGVNALRLRAYSSGTGLLQWDSLGNTNNVGQFDLSERSYSAPGTVVKQALAYATNDAAHSANAQTVTTDTSVILPVVTQADIGALAATRRNAHIRRITYYPARLPNAELVEMTA